MLRPRLWCGWTWTGPGWQAAAGSASQAGSHRRQRSRPPGSWRYQRSEIPGTNTEWKVIIHQYLIYSDFGIPKSSRNIWVWPFCSVLEWRNSEAISFYEHSPVMEKGRIHHYLILSGFGDSSSGMITELRLRNFISFRPRNSERFTKHMTIFLRFWSAETRKSEFQTREIGAFRLFSGMAWLNMLYIMENCKEYIHLFREIVLNPKCSRK